MRTGFYTSHVTQSNPYLGCLVVYTRSNVIVLGGKMFCFINSDTIWQPSKLLLMCENLEVV
jgi:hypothetical protein